jgi:hypothetical protein
MNTTANGVDIHTIGWILLIVGIVGILLSLIFWSSWAGPGGFSRRRTYYDEGPARPGAPPTEQLAGAAHPLATKRNSAAGRLRSPGGFV